MNSVEKLNKDQILEKLREVMDPEIPRLSIVDLGVVTDVVVTDENVKVKMTPTFAGCPATEVMKNDVLSKLNQIGVNNAEVEVSFETKWNSDMITDEGRKILKETGFAPPPKLDNGLFQIGSLSNVSCPFCESKNTRLQTPFGPTLCRAIHYCDNCRQSFEQFKPLQ